MKHIYSLILTSISLVAFATNHNVSVTSSFTPSVLSINQGDTVTWTQASGFHNVNGNQSTFPGNPASFGSGSVAGGVWTYSYVFLSPGVYNYHCDPHSSFMTGSITVSSTPKNVTFQVDMNNVTASFTNIYVSGTVNNWSGNSNQLTDADGDGVYEGTLSLMPGSYEFKFTYDNWTGQESFDATLDSACTLTTGAFTNRYITIGASDTTLPVFCWEECTSCATTSTGCNELFFSEYSEGSSNNKYIEIYNPTANAVSLSTYTVYQNGNGGAFTNLFTTSASIASGDVYVISTNQANATILAEADTAMAFPSVAHFNGDDALVLVNGTDTIDVIGVPGVDPGQS